MNKEHKYVVVQDFGHGEWIPNRLYQNRVDAIEAFCQDFSFMIGKEFCPGDTEVNKNIDGSIRFGKELRRKFWNYLKKRVNARSIRVELTWE